MQVTGATNSVSKPAVKGINPILGLGLLTVLFLSFALVNWVAANWSHILPKSRLVLVQSVFIASILVALVACWRNKKLADYLIQFAALVTGALLALIGQIYQTGADLWYLFAFWALLITPWLVLLRTVFVTILWALLLNITIFLLASNSAVTMLWLIDGNLWLALLNGLLLVLAIVCASYIDDSWAILRKIFAAATGLFIFLSLLQIQFTETSLELLFYYLLSFTLLGFAYLWFTKKSADLFIISVIFITAISIASQLVFHFADDFIGILLLAVFIIFASVIASMHLLKLWHLWYGKSAKKSQNLPWYFYFLRIIALLLAAVLFLTWLLLGFDFSDQNELLILALVILFISLVIAKALELKISNDKTNIFYESALVAVFSGLALFTSVWLLRSADFDNTAAWPIFILSLLVYLVLANFISKFLSSALMLAVCLWFLSFKPYLFDDIPVYLWSINASYLLSLFLASGFYLAIQTRYKQFCQPFAAALLVWATALAIGSDLLNTIPVWQWPLSAVLASLSLSLLPILFIAPAVRHLRCHLFVCTLLLVTSVGLFGAFTLLLGMSLLAFAVSYQKRALSAVAVVIAVIGLCLYYFQTGTSLNFKALQFALISLPLLICILLLVKTRNNTQRADFYLRPSKKYMFVAAFGAVLAIGFAQYQIKHYEDILHNGTKVVLKLAPIDPRSLMQGDYMQLNYAIRTDANSLLFNKDSLLIVSEDNSYWLILNKGKGNNWNLYAITDDLTEAQQLIDNNKNMAILKAKLQNGSLDWGANSWFFTEGKGDLYSQAVYGELRINKQGTALIAALLDAEFNKIE